MEEIKNNKIERVLGLYTKFLNGNIVNKAEEALNYNVNERSIQRDIDDIRNYLELQAEHSGFVNSIVYDRIDKGYRLEQAYKSKLTNGVILALCKILLDSRAFTKDEMKEIVGKLVDCCVPMTNRKAVSELLENELYHYVEPRHKTKCIHTIWEIGQAIRNRSYLEIKYYRMKDKKTVARKIKPVAIMFSEYYFYLTAFIDDKDVRKDFQVLNDSYPTIYRLDRIKKYRCWTNIFTFLTAADLKKGNFGNEYSLCMAELLEK